MAVDVRRWSRWFFGFAAAVAVTTAAILWIQRLAAPSSAPLPDREACAVDASPTAAITARPLEPRRPRHAGLHAPRRPGLDTGGAILVWRAKYEWGANATLEGIRDVFEALPRDTLAKVERSLASASDPRSRVPLLLEKATVLNYEGDARGAYRCLEEARDAAEREADVERPQLFSVIYFQGITALRCGENDNCLDGQCRTASSCLLPIAPAGVHTRPEGSRRAIQHFLEYLEAFPDDLEVKWLLNLAHMTLGEHPGRVDPRHVLSIEAFAASEFDIGRFTDVATAVGIDRVNEAGGAIMDDFDGDGLLDVALSSIDPTLPMALYRNRGDGTFRECAAEQGLSGQLGGLNCVQADYDNDGRLDIFVSRGAWLQTPMRPSLLRNAGPQGFVDVTEACGLLDPVNSNSAQWADYDNDGRLDLFVCCEMQPNRLYRNRGDGTFEEVAAAAGVQGARGFYKGAAWIDFDNDRDPDLFVAALKGKSRLYENVGRGRFEDVTTSMNLGAVENGFSCWAFDYDNDGWLDLFASCYDYGFAELVQGIVAPGEPTRHPSSLLHNRGGRRGFDDVARDAGLGAAYAAMGSNFADLDADGWLDLYLATGDPHLSTLVPNRLLRGVDGLRFSEITASAGMGHLQKGHGVACGDWDRDGDVDVFVDLGGAVKGDKFHNALFQNPGQGNHALTVRLVGKKTNRSAIGARIKAVTAGPSPLTVHRHVSSGSSFGANPLEQTLGVGAATRIALLEIYWPTSDTTQTFCDVAVDQVLRIVEFESAFEAEPLRRITSTR